MNEQQRRCDTGLHIIASLEQGQGREGHQQAQSTTSGSTSLRRRVKCRPLALIITPRMGMANKYLKKSTESGYHPRFVKRQGKQGIHPVGRSCDSSQNIAFGFHVHDPEFSRKDSILRPESLRHSHEKGRCPICVRRGCIQQDQSPPCPGRMTSGMPGTKRPCLYPRDYLAATCNRVHFLHYLYIKQPVKSQHHEQICFPTH